MKIKTSIKKKPKRIKPVINKLLPHCCPICGGNGLVSGSFYTSLPGHNRISTNVTEPCRSCKGVGIIWG